MDKNFFDDELFNRDDYEDAIEVAQNFVATPEEVIKQFVNNLIKDNNLDGFIKDRGVNCTSEYLQICLGKVGSIKFYYNEIKTISLKKQTMILTYKQVNNPKGYRNYGDMAFTFVINKRTNKLYVKYARYINPSDDYEVYEF